MPIIGRFPPFGKRFFRRARKVLGTAHFSHFWRAVAVLAGMHGRRSLDRMQKLMGGKRTRQAIAHFLTQAEWDAPELLQQTAMDRLRELGLSRGETVYLIVDDTQKQKRGKLMAAVSKIFLHAEKVYAQGHTILGCALVYRGVVIPYRVSLWCSEESCATSQLEDDPLDRITFRKLTELAADAIREVGLPAGVKAITLFDSYYLCPKVIKACADQGFRYVGVAKKNRNFTPDGRWWDKRKLKSYGANVLKRTSRPRTVRGKRYHLAERVGNLSKAGRVKLVFSRRPGEKRWIALATNETRWSVQTVLGHYLCRWGIEVFFKMSKQHLGLGDYQLLRYRGIVRYLCLVLIASLLLTHLGIQRLGAKAKTTTTLLQLPSLAQLQQVLRDKLWDDLIDSFENSSQCRVAARKLKKRIQR